MDRLAEVGRLQLGNALYRDSIAREGQVVDQLHKRGRAVRVEQARPEAGGDEERHAAQVDRPFAGEAQPDVRKEPEAYHAQAEDVAEVDVRPEREKRHQQPRRLCSTDKRIDKHGEQKPAQQLRTHRPERRADQHRESDQAERDRPWRAQAQQQPLHQRERGERDGDEEAQRRRVAEPTHA